MRARNHRLDKGVEDMRPSRWRVLLEVKGHYEAILAEGPGELGVRALAAFRQMLVRTNTETAKLRLSLATDAEVTAATMQQATQRTQIQDINWPAVKEVLDILEGEFAPEGKLVDVIRAAVLTVAFYPEDTVFQDYLLRLQQKRRSKS